MNKKTLSILVLMGLSLSAVAQQQQQQPVQQGSGQGSGDQAQMMQMMMAQNSNKGSAAAARCVQTLSTANVQTPGAQEAAVANPEVEKCKGLQAITGELEGNRVAGGNGIICRQTAGYTLDFKYCEAAANAMSYVIAAEAAMNLQQQVRTDLKNQNIQKKANQAAAVGDLQTGMFDASIESNKHQKSMMQEKMVAYTAAVGALGMTYTKWPSDKKIKQQAAEKCGNGVTDKAKCTQYVNGAEGDIVANSGAKSTLIAKITEYIGKGVAAGIAAGQFDTAAKQVEAAKDTIAPDDAEDVMMERCMFNPTDPVCAKTGNRVSGATYAPGDFSMGEGSGNNAFNMTPGTDNFGEIGDEATLGNGTVASANSPFIDDAKKANDILNPAAAANVQPGSAPGGGGGGVGGGGGGGSASLGSDLEGADKDGDKAADLKTTKSGGNYSAAGGGGFAAVKGGKDNANPFADLFGAKSAGGIEEDRSIASGDIDGAASGLFQKISKRYGQVQADKRIEGNLE